jgi:hypothetical protein
MTSKRNSKVDTEHERQQLPVRAAIERYLSDIDALEFAFPLTRAALDAASKSFSEGFAKNLAAETTPALFRKFAREFSQLLEPSPKTSATDKQKTAKKKPKRVSIPISGENDETISSLLGIGKVSSADELISRSFVVTLVSQFDAYIAALVRALYQIRPDILSLHSKSISYSELIELGSVESVEQRLIEGEIESLLRSSHSEQFKWLEAKFDIKLKESQENWGRFIELTERRNLFVHADAQVSSQYLRVCSTNKVDLPSDCKIGSRLNVSKEYFESAYSLLAEMGVKLGIILWRKVCPEQQDRADAYLTELIVELIKSEKYLVAKSISEAFLLNIPKGSRTESVSRMMVINLAQCLKWLGHEQACIELLGKYDWSASAPLYSLGVAVLKDDFATAKKLLKVAMDAESISIKQVRTWPLFRKFRESDEFAALHAPVEIGANEPNSEVPRASGEARNV